MPSDERARDGWGGWGTRNADPSDTATALTVEAHAEPAAKRVKRNESDPPSRAPDPTVHPPSVGREELADDGRSSDGGNSSSGSSTSLGWGDDVEQVGDDLAAWEVDADGPTDADARDADPRVVYDQLYDPALAFTSGEMAALIADAAAAARVSAAVCDVAVGNARRLVAAIHEELLDGDRSAGPPPIANGGSATITPARERAGGGAPTDRSRNAPAVCVVDRDPESGDAVCLAPNAVAAALLALGASVLGVRLCMTSVREACWRRWGAGIRHATAETKKPARTPGTCQYLREDPPGHGHVADNGDESPSETDNINDNANVGADDAWEDDITTSLDPDATVDDATYAVMHALRFHIAVDGVVQRRL